MRIYSRALIPTKLASQKAIIYYAFKGIEDSTSAFHHYDKGPIPGRESFLWLCEIGCRQIDPTV